MSHLYPMLIEPRYDERIWGGHNLAERLGKPAPRDKPIGESWEVYEENRVVNGPSAGRTIGELRREGGRELTGHVPPDRLFPLLTKLIDAQDVLSVQVHPDDRFARDVEHQPYGKTECWYIIRAEPGAQLIYGFCRDSSPEEYRRLVEEGRLETILRPLPVRAGDVVYLPARTVHAIGAGILLYELQQTSDLTYRIYDWNRRDASGRPRDLHVDKASQVLDYQGSSRGAVQPIRAPDGCSILIAAQYFCMELVDTSTVCELSTHDSPVPICALESQVRLRTPGGTEEVLVPPYSSALIPAAAGSFSVAPAAGADDGCRALVAYVPTSRESIRADLVERGFPASQVDGFLAQFWP